MTTFKHIKRDEIDEITKPLPTKHKALLQTAYFGGLRLGELNELKREDLKFKEESVEISLPYRTISLEEPRDILKEYIDDWESEDEDHLWSIDGVTIRIIASTDSDINPRSWRYSRFLELDKKWCDEKLRDFFGLHEDSNVLENWRKIESQSSEDSS